MPHPSSSRHYLPPLRPRSFQLRQQTPTPNEKIPSLIGIKRKEEEDE